MRTLSRTDSHITYIPRATIVVFRETRDPKYHPLRMAIISERDGWARRRSDIVFVESLFFRCPWTGSGTFLGTIKRFISLDVVNRNLNRATGYKSSINDSFLSTSQRFYESVNNILIRLARGSYSVPRTCFGLIIKRTKKEREGKKQGGGRKKLVSSACDGEIIFHPKFALISRRFCRH